MKTTEEQAIYNLLWMIAQFCCEEDSLKGTTRYNADALSVDFLWKQGYIDLPILLDKNKWPYTKYISFEINEKGKELLYKDFKKWKY